MPRLVVQILESARVEFIARSQVVGTEREDAIYIFHYDDVNQEWEQFQHIEQPDEGKFGHDFCLSYPWLMISAPEDSDAGFEVGAVYAYKFDPLEGPDGQWVQQQKLTPFTGWTQQFGYSIDVSGDRMLVGVPFADDRCAAWGHCNSGSFFSYRLHNDTFWSFERHVWLGAEATEGEHVGWDVAIYGDTAMIGAPGNNWVGVGVGSVYWYEWDLDTSQWVLQEQILAPDAGQTSEGRFGEHIKLSQHLLLVFHRTAVDPDNFYHTGSVHYLVRNGGGYEELYELMPRDIQHQDHFGRHGMAIGDDRLAIASVFVGSAPGLAGHGAVYIWEWIDEDEDGILDCWEEEGIDINADLEVDLDLTQMFADPRQKTLYVEVDVANGQNFPSSVATMVEAAFDDAPVDNPDGTQGIELVIMIDETDLPVAAVWATDASGWAPDFDALKAVHFGLDSWNGQPNGAEKRKAWRLVSRYCIVGRDIDDGSDGTGEIGGNDLFLTPDGITNLSTENYAALFMHELGHNLGLRHGGHDNVNGKPNYVSVMNYLLSAKFAWNTPFWRLDYSRDKIEPILNEIALDETVGIQPSSEHPGVFMPFGVDGPGGTRQIAFAHHAGIPVDWNGDGHADHPTAVQDLNYFGPNAAFAAFASPSFNDDMKGHDDWENIELPIGFNGEFADAQHGVLPEEAPVEFFNWLEQIEPPIGTCAADLTDSTGGGPDGDVNVFDLLELLSNWGTNGPGANIADPPNNVVDVFDLIALLEAWGSCR